MQQMETLGARLKAARPAGMTQEHVARVVGVHRQAIIRWEAGETEPAISQLLQLARLYGVTLAALTGEE